jgi:tetratricopeptide (TPR) repeat protein
LDVAAKLVTPEEETRWLQHAAECDCCAWRLARANDLVNAPLDDDLAALTQSIPSSTPAGQAALLDKLAGPSRIHTMPKPKPALPIRWVALAASVLVGVAIWQAAPRLLNWREDRMLAAAFRQGRPSSYRLDDMPYGPVVADRSGAPRPNLPAPPASESSRPRQAALFALREGQSSEAVLLLEEARRRGDSSPAVLNDLGVAYAMKGDTTRARSLFEEILRQDPSHKAALFNLALLNDSAGRKDETRALLERLQQKEGDPGWRAEIEGILRQRP